MMRATAAAVSAVKVAAPSATDSSGSSILANALRSSDFGHGAAKNGSASTRATNSSSTRPLRRLLAVAIEPLSRARAHEVVDQRIAGPDVAGDRLALAVDIGDVGDAADIEHGDRMRPVEPVDQRAVKDRHERRALPARRHVGGAEIEHDRNAQPLRERSVRRRSAR